MTTKFWRNHALIWAAIGCALYLVVCFGGCNPANAKQVLYIPGNDTTWAGMTWQDRMLISDLRTKLLDTVSVMSDSKIATSGVLSGYELIVLSRNISQSLAAPLRDTIVPMVIMNLYNYDEFRLATGYYASAGFYPCYMAKEANTYWQQRNTTDSGYISPDNVYPAAMTGLCAGAQKILNPPRWLGKDTSMYFVVDSGGALTTETAAHRRAFLGQFNPFFMSSALYSKCRLIETFLNACKWASDDTLNNAYQCYGQATEIGGAWTETASPPSDSQTFCSNLRMGYDYAPIVSFLLLKKPALSRKYIDNWDSDSMVYLWNYYHAGFNAPPCANVYSCSDSLYDFTEGWFRLIPSAEWTVPAIGSGGTPRGTDTWVNRYNVIGGSSPTKWSVKNLAAGVDYDATPLCSLRWNKNTVVGGTDIRWNFGGEVFDIWANDTSKCRGLVAKPIGVWNPSCGSCNIEMVNNSSYNVDYGTQANYIEVWSSTPDDPRIAFSPDSLVFSCITGTNPASKTTTLWNSSQGAYQCTLTVNSSWLTLINYCGGYVVNGEDCYMSNIVSTSGLPAGVYYDTVMIYAGAASNSPQFYQVSLIVSDPPSPGQVQKMSGFLRTKQ